MEGNIMTVGTMEDRISQLPDVIVHHILSFLDSPAELVRCSVLSQKWFAVTASFPILDFNMYESNNPYMFCEYYFLKYVEYTTSRFCEQNVSAHTFKLIIRIEDPTEEVDIIDRCIKSILMKHVKVLLIDVSNSPGSPEPLPMYRLPDTLLSTSSLTSLTVCGCELPSSLMLVDVKFKSLKLLELEYVPLDEEMIKRLTSSCPLLEEFNVEDCYGFKMFCVYGLQNLQKLRINYDSEVEIIDIEAPNLWCLLLEGGESVQWMNLASCKKLTTLSYYVCSYTESIVFADFLSNFPFIENLFLTLPRNCHQLKLSSTSLRTIMLCSSCDLDEIDMDTPNLLLFVCHDNRHMPDPLIRHSAETKACIECHPEDGLDTLWFLTLRRFFNKKNKFKVFKLYILFISSIRNFIDVEELKLIQLPAYELERVELELDFTRELSFYFDVVDAILWCIRPRTLTLRSIFRSINFRRLCFVVMFTYMKLIEQEEDETDIQIFLSSSSKTKKHYSDFYSLFIALHIDRLDDQTITFIKEEATKEEAG